MGELMVISSVIVTSFIANRPWLRGADGTGGGDRRIHPAPERGPLDTFRCHADEVPHRTAGEIHRPHTWPRERRLGTSQQLTASGERVDPALQALALPD